MNKTLHVAVVNKIATYHKRGGAIVCGNSDYLVKFTFDSEWDAHAAKTARFIWGGGYRDITFTGDTCVVPAVQNTTELRIGVYVQDLSTSTSAVVGCVPSILCDGGEAFDKDADVAQLEQQMLALQEQIAELEDQSQVPALEAQVAELQRQNQTLTQQATSLQKQNRALEEQVAELEQENEALEESRLVHFTVDYEGPFVALSGQTFKAWIDSGLCQGVAFCNDYGGVDFRGIGTETLEGVNEDMVIEDGRYYPTI